MEKNGQESVPDHRDVHPSLVLIFDWKIFVRAKNSNNLHRARIQCSSRGLLRNLLIQRAWLATGDFPCQINFSFPTLLYGLPTWGDRHCKNPSAGEQPSPQRLFALHCDLKPINYARAFLRAVH